MIEKVDPPQRLSIVRLDEHSVPEALDILTDAFQDDPMIKHMFPAKTKMSSQSFFKYLLKKSALLNELLLGLECNGELVGVANLEVPTGKGKKPGVFRMVAFIYQSLLLTFRISFQNFIFINRYMKFTSSLRPKNSHHYLIFISVAPKHQGKGFGRMLLDHIHLLVAQSPHSSGIGLDTENHENVPLYERFGYRLIGSELFEPVTIYGMFRSKQLRSINFE